MRRRNFLKTIAGVVGAIATGLKIKPPAVPAPVPVSAPPFPVRFIVDEACPPDRIYMFCTPAQAKAYDCLAYTLKLNGQDETA
jgi:hypothetical protein